ncbi:MAG: tetratricopeptide repeat protein [bacterium]
MRLSPSILALIIAVAATSSPAADAEKPAAPSKVEKKQSSMFSRPKKQTPAEQLAYAGSLKNAGKRSEAAKQYNTLVQRWPDSTQASVAQLEYARILEAAGDYAAAFDEYEYLIQYYPGQFQYADVLESEFRIANAIMTSRSKILGILPGSAGYSTALPLFERVVINAPQWSGTPKAQFNIGWIHENLEAYDLAADAYELVQQNYPRSEVAADAAFQQGYCLYVIAKTRPNEERGLLAVRAHFQRFLRSYPDHAAAGDAAGYLNDILQRLTKMAYERAVFYDKGNHAKAAVIAYKDFMNKFPDAPQARIAQLRIEELGDEAGTVKTQPEPGTDSEHKHISGGISGDDNDR